MSSTEPSGGGESDRSETVFIFVKGKGRLAGDIEDRKRMARLFVNIKEVDATLIKGGEMRQNHAL
jgi:hypothetical protein